MRKPYVLVSGIIKKSLQPIDERKEGRKEGVKIYIFVTVCYNSFDASRIHEVSYINYA